MLSNLNNFIKKSSVFFAPPLGGFNPKKPKMGIAGSFGFFGFLGFFRKRCGKYFSQHS